MTIKRIDREPVGPELLMSLRGDPISRNQTLKRFVATLDEIEGAFSIFLNSPWGDGKTFFVKQLCLILQLSNDQLRENMPFCAQEYWEENSEAFPVNDLYLPVYFNAWRNDDYNDPLLPLLGCIASSCEYAEVGKRRNAKEAIAAAVDSAAALVGLNLNTSNLVEGFSGESFLDGYEKREAFRSQFDEAVSSALREIASTTVIFVDDLDRCRPDFAVKLLEQTKALFARENVIMVFSTDMLQLGQAIRGLYGVSTDPNKYLERFYDMKIDLPPVDAVRYLKYMGFGADSQHLYTNVANGFISAIGSRFVCKMRNVACVYRNSASKARYLEPGFARI